MMHRTARTSLVTLVCIASICIARAGSDYADFLNALAQRESSLNRSAENSQTHYIGLFQFGEAALKDIGVYNGDSTKKNDWAGGWSGKYGATSKEAFLNNGDAQLQAIAAYEKMSWDKYLKGNGADAYIGKTINGVEVTESGLVAAAHLVGAGTVLNWLRSNGATSPTDASGTQMTEYMSKFGGYNIANFAAPSYSEFQAANPSGGKTPGSTGGSGSSSAKPNPVAGSTYANVGDGFAGGSGANMSVMREVITGVIASLAFLWLAYICYGCWAGWSAGKFTAFDLKSYILQAGVVLAVILWMVAA